MDVPLPEPMTLDQFLAWDKHQPDRWEFDGSKPIPWTGGTVRRARLVGGSVRYTDRLILPDGTPGFCTLIENPITTTLVSDPQAVLDMPEIDSRLLLSDVYDDIIPWVP